MEEDKIEAFVDCLFYLSDVARYLINRNHFADSSLFEFTSSSKSGIMGLRDRNKLLNLHEDSIIQEVFKDLSLTPKLIFHFHEKTFISISFFI